MLQLLGSGQLPMRIVCGRAAPPLFGGERPRGKGGGRPWPANELEGEGPVGEWPSVANQGNTCRSSNNPIQGQSRACLSSRLRTCHLKWPIGRGFTGPASILRPDVHDMCRLRLEAAYRPSILVNPAAASFLGAALNQLM
jgi:hypothetical protein